MTIKKMKQTTFDKANFSTWKEVAVQTLKGKPFESLMTHTIEGIQLQPLYTKEHVQNTNRSVKGDAEWIIAQQTIETDGEQFIVSLKQSLERGNEAIVYDGTRQISWTENSLKELAQLATKYPVYFFNTHSKDQILTIFNLIPSLKRPLVKGAILVDGWVIPDGFNEVRTIGANMWTVHHKGADAIIELALALAYAAKYAPEQEDIAQLADRFFVHFAVDTHFFMEIAKIRAFRLLWQAFGAAYGLQETPDVTILATTSLRSFSKLDPYVNLLRAGNEAFAAVLAGVDVLTVHPHDILTGPETSSIRYARNIQLVLKEETHINKVIDPSNGSYFIETLTSELVDKAWSLFLTVQSEGGYDSYISNGKLTNLLGIRRHEVAEGKKSLIGTNVYAELTDLNFNDWDGIQVEGRLAVPFEQLRHRLKDHQPRTVLLTFGELKDFKPRADFVSGFLATGGIHAEWSPSFKDVKEALTWLADEKPAYAVICATPSLTEAVTEQLISQRPKNVILDVAGKVEDKLAVKWLEAGLNGFIYSGQDKIAKLHDIENKWKGASSNE